MPLAMLPTKSSQRCQDQMIRAIIIYQAKYEKIPQNNISCQKCSVKNNYLFPFQKLMKYVDVHILLHSLKSGSLVAFWLFFVEDFLSNTICDKALIAWEVALILLWEPLLFFCLITDRNLK